MENEAVVNARMRYVNPEWRNSKVPPRIGSRETRQANTSYRDVQVHNARVAEDDLGLERSGFTLRTHVTSDAGSQDADRRRVYRNEMLDLVRHESGADRTFLLADLVRTEDQSNFNFAYARFVHCDYNLDNLRQMSLDLLRRREVEPQSGWVFAWYNTWQPFDHVANQNPLALLDVRSIADDDIIAYRYTGYSGSDDEGGLVSAPVYNPDHRWYFYPAMTPDEVLLSKQLDTRPGHTSQCPHTSFVDESQPDDVPPRRSIESRILAVFEDGGQMG